MIQISWLPSNSSSFVPHSSTPKLNNTLIMKGIVFRTTGDSSVLQIDEHLDVPEHKETEVLVKVAYAGVNFIDIYQRDGLYPMPLPTIVGREASGTIMKIGTAVDPAWNLEVGHRVAVFGQGSMAEYVCAPASRIMKLPANLSMQAGAALMLQGLTALTLARDAHPVQQGETVLIRAAAGGTGGLLAQICKELGAMVIGTVSVSSKAEVAHENGCHHVLVLADCDEASEVRRLTGGLGCHAVFTGVGQSTFAADMACTRRKGTLCSFGNSSGAVKNFNILDLSKNNIRLVRPSLGNYITTDEEFRTRADQLLDMVDRGAIKVSYGREYDFASVRDAQDDLAAGKTVGKSIVKIS
jgi:NADPH:quinone reductase